MRTEDEQNLAEAVTRLSADVDAWKSLAERWAIRAWAGLLAACIGMAGAFHVGRQSAKSDPREIVCTKTPPLTKPCLDHVIQDYGRFVLTCPHPEQRMVVVASPVADSNQYQLITCTCPRSK